MESLIQLIMVVIYIVSFVGWVLLLIAGFRTTVWWGLGILLLTPIVGLIFAIKYWERARLGCLLQLIPIPIAIVLALVFGQQVASIVGDEAMEASMQMESPVPVDSSSDSDSSGSVSSGSGSDAGGGSPDVSAATEPTPTPAPVARRQAPSFQFREFRVEELPSAIGKSVRVDLTDGRERNGKLLSIDDGTLRLEQRSSGGTMEFPVRVDQVKRILVRVLVE